MKNAPTRHDFGQKRRCELGQKKSGDQYGSRFKKIKTDKPDSVLRPKAKRPSFIYPIRRRIDLSTYPPSLGEQPSNLGLHGLSVREVYPPCRLPGKAMGSYPTLFTLTSGLRRRRYRLCGTFCPDFHRSFPLGSAVPCTVRTFLPDRKRTSAPRPQR